MTDTPPGPTVPDVHPGRLLCRAYLVHRLVEHHGLAPAEASTAVLQAERHEPGPHADLVTAEARAVADEAAQIIQASRTAFRAVLPALRAVADAFQTAHEQLAAAHVDVPPAPGRRPDRPAYQSPYGPPTRRH